MYSVIKRKKYTTLLLFIVLLLILQGCSIPETDSNPAGGGDQAIKSVTVTDYFDREVVITKPVKNIACGYAYTGHVVTMLGRGEDIVAVVDGLRRDKVLTTIHPHIKELPVPFRSGTINIEELLECKPDIVFLKSDTASNKNVVEKLDKLEIPYIVIDFYSIDEQIKSIYLIGKVIGEEEKAQNYIDYYLKVVDDTRRITEKIPQEDRVKLYHSVNEATRTDLKNSLPAEWIEVTGVINVSVNEELKISGEKSFATLEQIYKWDPDVIIANEAEVPEYIMENKQWSALRAVKERRVYQIPNGVSRWGHPGSMETPLAILWTSKLIYPEYFENIDMEYETKRYYKNFFNLELSDETVREILRGKGMREAKSGK